MAEPTTIIVVGYAGLSFVLGVAAALYEAWSEPMMLDRADGRGKFPAPKDDPIWVGLSVAVCWPILVVLAILDERGT